MDPRDRRTGVSYLDALTEQATRVAPRLASASTSFFSTPSEDLDPRLFEVGTVHLRPAVRLWIMSTLDAFWGERGYHNAAQWAKVWIAGSGITYQWAAAREPGDLDVLIGVDFDQFMQANQRYRGMGEDELAAQFNSEFHSGLDHTTAAATLPGSTGTFEVTWFVNPDASDIRDIHPYAAYDVGNDQWTVKPPVLPMDWNPRVSLPAPFWDAIDTEQHHARKVLSDYALLRSKLAEASDPARRVNLAVQLRALVRRGAEMFYAMHAERRLAFSTDGQGYADYYNARWQAGKASGIIQALHELAVLHSETEQASQTELYGKVLANSATAVHAAAMATSLPVVLG